ncbi:MAG TPA: hypothetical protein PLF24_01025 [Ruminococcus sp.]|nr:hypothetical protein [Ruminococcus sp.]
MKKSMLILILAGLLTACTVTHDEENCESSINSAPFSENNTKSESYAEIETQPLTEDEISTAETTVTTAEIQSETVCTTAVVINVQKEKIQYDSTEFQQNNTDEIAENPTDHTESNTENALE